MAYPLKNTYAPREILRPQWEVLYGPQYSHFALSGKPNMSNDQTFNAGEARSPIPAFAANCTAEFRQCHSNFQWTNCVSQCCRCHSNFRWSSWANNNAANGVPRSYSSYGNPSETSNSPNAPKPTSFVALPYTLVHDFELDLIISQLYALPGTDRNAYGEAATNETIRNGFNPPHAHALNASPDTFGRGRSSELFFGFPPNNNANKVLNHASSSQSHQYNPGMAMISQWPDAARFTPGATMSDLRYFASHPSVVPEAYRTPHESSVYDSIASYGSQHTPYNFLGNRFGAYGDETQAVDGTCIDPATDNWYAKQDINASETDQTNTQLPWNSMNTEISNATATKQSAGQSNSFYKEGIVNQKHKFNQATRGGTSTNSGAAAMMINTRQPAQGQRCHENATMVAVPSVGKGYRKRGERDAPSTPPAKKRAPRRATVAVVEREQLKIKYHFNITPKIPVNSSFNQKVARMIIHHPSPGQTNRRNGALMKGSFKDGKIGALQTIPPRDTFRHSTPLNPVRVRGRR